MSKVVQGFLDRARGTQGMLRILGQQGVRTAGCSGVCVYRADTIGNRDKPFFLVSQEEASVLWTTLKLLGALTETVA